MVVHDARYTQLELRLEENGIKSTAATAMEEMRHLHSVLSIVDGRTNPRRQLEVPTETQAGILAALDHCVDAQGVLQPIDG